MILTFNSDTDKSAITCVRVFRGHIGLFFAVMEKLGSAPFLWWSEILTVRVDFEQQIVKLNIHSGKKDSIEIDIPFRELLELNYPDLVREYMRPFAAGVAEAWCLPQTAAVIESGGDREAIEAAIIAEDPPLAKTTIIALTNILYETAKVPWEGVSLT